MKMFDDVKVTFKALLGDESWVSSLILDKTDVDETLHEEVAQALFDYADIDWDLDEDNMVDDEVSVDVTISIHDDSKAFHTTVRVSSELDDDEQEEEIADAIYDVICQNICVETLKIENY